MLSKYKILFSGKAKKDFQKLDERVQKRIASKIKELLKLRLSTQLKALKGDDIAQFRLRVGDYRILYDVYHADKVVYILRIGHRKEIYN